MRGYYSVFNPRGEKIADCGIERDAVTLMHSRNKNWDGHYFQYNPLPGPIVDINQTKELEKALNSAKQKLASQQGADMLSSAVEINGVKVLVANLEGVEAKSLRSMMDDIKNRIGEGIVVLGVAGDAKVNLIAGVTKNLTSKVKAGELVNFVASQVGGKGGGRPDMAQAGGDKPENLPAALDSVNAWLQDKL